MRATISFPPDVYETLEVIAKEKKVSLAWVVRDARGKTRRLRQSGGCGRHRALPGNVGPGAY